MPSTCGSDRMARMTGSGSTRAAASCVCRSPEFGAVRQPAVPEQEADLLERRAALGVRQIVDVVALIRQHAPVAVEVADRRFAGDDVFEAGLGLCVSSSCSRLLPPSREAHAGSAVALVELLCPPGDLRAPWRARRRRSTCWKIDMRPM